MGSQDAKKEEFKKYLEKAGVLELLTKSLVSLYEEPEKPNDAVNYLKKSVGGTDGDKVEIDKLQTENTELKAKIAALEESQGKLQAKLTELEKAGGSGDSAPKEDDKEPAPMEESVETPAAAESAPAEPEPTKEAEIPAEPQPAEPAPTEEAKETGSTEEPMEAESAPEPVAESAPTPASTEAPTTEATEAPVAQ